MDKYKINIIYSENGDINDLVIKVLNKELKNMICKEKEIDGEDKLDFR